MVKLLLLRLVPLVLRPAVVMIEAMVLESDKILIYVMPISMIALALSSVPVHLDFYKASGNSKEVRNLAKQYVSSVTWILLVAPFVLCFFLMLPIMDLGMEMALLITFTFIVEKISDEISRSLEFSKKFNQWFLIQSMRSCWFGFPIVFYIQGYDYVTSFILAAIITSVVCSLLFVRVIGLKFNLTSDGLAKVYKNSIYLVGTLLPISYRQAPRLIVAKQYPDVAHIFLAVSQISQGVSVLFNVKYQIPYRKAIARHTYIFQRIYWPSMRFILILSISISALYCLLSPWFDIRIFTDLEFSLLLAPLLVINALVFCILSSYLGYMTWVVDRWQALATFLYCMGIGLVIYLALFYFELISSIFIFSACTSLIGIFWVFFIVWRHFYNISSRLR